jgi:hypothetical protein
MHLNIDIWIPLLITVFKYIFPVSLKKFLRLSPKDFEQTSYKRRYIHTRFYLKYFLLEEIISKTTMKAKDTIAL